MKRLHLVPCLLAIAVAVAVVVAYGVKGSTLAFLGFVLLCPLMMFMMMRMMMNGPDNNHRDSDSEPHQPTHA